MEVSLSKPTCLSSLPRPPAVHRAEPTVLLIMKHKDFYLMTASLTLWPHFYKKRKRLFKGIFQLVSTEARGEHLCLRRLLLDESTWPTPLISLLYLCLFCSTNTAGDGIRKEFLFCSYKTSLITVVCREFCCGEKVKWNVVSEGPGCKTTSQDELKVKRHSFVALVT